MRQGRGRRRGRGRRKRMQGFLQPCILVQLAAGDRHGYDLYQGLGEFLADAHTFDPSMVYRQMRDLEDSGQVVSYEGDASLGPKRKMYALTDEGRKVLDLWVQDMERTRREIEILLAHYHNDSPPPDAAAVKQSPDEDVSA